MEGQVPIALVQLRDHPERELAFGQAGRKADGGVAAGPLADLCHLFGRQPGTIHDAATADSFSNCLSPARRVTSLARLTISSPPQTRAAGPSRPWNAGANEVPSAARRAKLFLMTSKWMFFAPQFHPQAMAAIGVHPGDAHQQGVVDAVEALLKVVGD